MRVRVSEPRRRPTCSCGAEAVRRSHSGLPPSRGRTHAAMSGFWEAEHAIRLPQFLFKKRHKSPTVAHYGHCQQVVGCRRRAIGTRRAATPPPPCVGAWLKAPLALFGDGSLTTDSAYVAPWGDLVGSFVRPSAGGGRGIVVAGHLKLVQTAISPRYILRGDRSWVP